ncbi:MAG: hypothetical protein G01um101448_736 [Parcubacteria group bacterium Gr01-1014_48]|nr:MAG: hypothetical protein Greene041614_170 [Parcubacteria group bacterium Greene0416_14]TSC73493.1 MAG: hypothetical protein G01um101448_736 [Parcubacteria group bacterium Gr01-1014_48]TSD01226.1 MAG: hypothetical protein Greene101415_421 [Parcubacteria group bacterium Greene1014_15]TSD08309.1 MAG: hypothetical protein Greene07144_195 [Parcubacteria group bacterium Greene0714_4]
MDTNNTIQPQTPPQKQGQIGAVIGIIIIIVVLALGGLYVWGARLNKVTEPNGETAEDIMNSSDPTTDNLTTQGTSDDLSAIEDDLDTTSLDQLDAEMNSINAEVQ